MKLLLAGASGMAGRGILRALARSHPDQSVRAIVFNQTMMPEYGAEVEIVRADLRQSADCDRVAVECDAAVLAAAVTGGVGQSSREPWRQVNDNLVMYSQILAALHRAGVKRCLLIGSATLYQDFQGLIREEQLDWSQDPPEVYFGVGWVWRALEKMAEFWCRNAEMTILCLRSANIYGPFAQFNPRHSNFIPALIRKAVAHQNPFEVWGSAETIRDVIFVDDFAEAIVKLLFAHDVQGFDVFNVGSGHGVTVGEVVGDVLNAAVHEQVQVHYASGSPTSARSRVLNCDKIEARTGWRAHTSLAQGVKLTVDWWTKNQFTWTR